MLMALLLPDPCDEHCSAEFKAQARRLLAPVPMIALGPEDADLRKALLKFIADFANWDNSANQTYLTCARGLVQAAHGEEPPLVVDPFAGGGSIPLEALRVGCDAFASDLNPVACLILKVLLEDIPRHGPGLADDLRRVGKEIKDAAEKELAEFYPADPDGARPVAYLWARTVRCESPKCGAEIPLVRSFWLSKKTGRQRALTPVPRRGEGHPVDHSDTLKSETCLLHFEIVEPESESEVHSGTVKLGNATCSCCKAVLPVARVRAQLATQRGGANVAFDKRGQRIGGARLLAVVLADGDGRQRSFRGPTERDYRAIYAASMAVEALAKKLSIGGKSFLPDEAPPQDGTGSVGGGYRTRKYGITQFRDFFSDRQALALATIGKSVNLMYQNGGPEAKSLAELVALAVDKVADFNSSLSRWRAASEDVANLFGRQALPMVWDFVETNPFCHAYVGVDRAVSHSMDVVRRTAQALTAGGQVQVADAGATPLPSDSASIWFTDPPYYDAVPYADLSDYFFVWLKRFLPSCPELRDPFDQKNPLTPKVREAVRDEQTHLDGRPRKPAAWYEEAMFRAFLEGRRVLRGEGVGSVVFAHKTTEGWEALISGLLSGGWTVTASWPITTEMGSRLRARESAALAASVHLVCRPRQEKAGTGGWEDILHELPGRIGDWMERLSSEGIRGADLVFSCIGPALELFSKYDKVETAEGREVKLDEFLAKVWEVVGRTALQHVLGTAEARARNGAAAALEEDARLTALFLWTLQSTDGNQKAEKAKADEDKPDEGVDEDEEEETGKAKKGFTLIYDVVRRFAQPLGIHLEAWDGRIIEVKKGVVRLLPVLEREEQLFGTSGTAAVARTLERTGGRDPQYMLFPEKPEGRPAGGRRPRRSRTKEDAEALAPRREATTLDRVHAAMLLQARGEATALRALLEAENERSPDFLRLANALSALYPKDSEEKRLLDAMLLAVPR